MFSELNDKETSQPNDVIKNRCNEINSKSLTITKHI